MKDDLKVMKEMFLGKVVQIYPGDTYSKWGKVIDINDKGVLFDVVKVQRECDGWCKGMRFITWNNRLSFRLLDKSEIFDDV